MTDIYVRRSESPDPRRRAALFLIIVIVLVVACVAVIRLGCHRKTDSEKFALQVNDDPLVDELIKLHESDSTENESLSQPSATPQKSTALSAKVPASSAIDENDPGVELLTEARGLRDKGDLLDAREQALSVLERSRINAARTRAIDLLNEVSVQLVFTPRSMPQKVEYVVQPGDSLARLAKKFNTTIELIKRSNDIRGTVIRVGDRLRILQAPFHMEIDKSDNLLDLYLDGQFFKRYRVGTGEFNKTPVGTFKITDRIASPTWWRPDGKAIPFGNPENELGTHWLSLDLRGYGIHGTWEPETIGKQSSAGCIRLVNEEIEEL